MTGMITKPVLGLTFRFTGKFFHILSSFQSSFIASLLVSVGFSSGKPRLMWAAQGA